MTTPRKKTCYFPQASDKPFTVHHNDYGIFSELRITNVSRESVIVGVIINDEFAPPLEVAANAAFQPLALPRKLRFGESFAALLQGPSLWVQPGDCLKGYPTKVLISLGDGSAIQFGIWDLIRCRG